MKKRLSLLLAFALLMGFMAVLEVHAKGGIGLVVNKLKLGVNDEAALWLIDSNASYYDALDALYSSSNSAVVSVEKDDGYAFLTAKKIGKAVITAQYKGKKYTCSITVTKRTITYSYNKKDKTATVTGCRGQYKKLNIPAKVKGYKVTQVKTTAFIGHMDIEKVVLPDTITKLGYGSFSACYNLKEVVWSNKLDTIGGSAFANTKLKKVILPQSVKKIGNSAFEECASITKLSLPAGIKSIGESAFYGCNSLKEIEIPNDFVKMGEFAFAYCRNLKIVKFPSTWYNMDGYTFWGTKWIKNLRKKNPLVVINGILIDADKCKGEVTVPEGVIRIGCGAFDDNEKVTRIILPSSVEKIDSGAIVDCYKLKEVVIPNMETQLVYDSIDVEKVTICAPDGSFAHYFAKILEYKYKPYVVQ